jgi:hypothetical protein
MKKSKCFLFLCATIFCLLRPITIDAYITFSTRQYPNYWDNPAPSAANIELVTHAISRLAGDPRLVKHPIRRYFSGPAFNAHIVFDNPTLNARELDAQVMDNNQILMRSNEDLAYYLKNAAHEFIHIAMSEKYGPTTHSNFLYPEDYAFQNLMEEAFANAVEVWVHLTYPEIPNDPHIRNWRRQTAFTATVEAMYNDFRADYPGLSAGLIIDIVAGEMIRLLLINANIYSMQTIPHNMAISYGQQNTILIPEYAAYRERGDVLLRHKWNYLVSMMPFSLPEEYSFDYFRSRFRSDYTQWALRASAPERSILFWVNFPAVEQARARIARQRPRDVRYDYLAREYEERLNRVMREIDPHFVPVNTLLTPQRILQNARER